MDKELYIQIRDDIADDIIKHGLSKTESKLFFYLLKLDRFGDKPAKVKVAEIMLATGIGKTAYHQAIVKFEMLGWFDFKHSDVEITNNCTPAKQSAIPNYQSAKTNSESAKPEKRTGKANQKTGKTNSRRSKPLPSEDSTASHTIQTYTDFIHTLSDSEGERFESFCNGKIKSLNFAIASKSAWLNKHYLEYWEEFQKAHKAYEPPQKPQSLEEIKLMFKSAWKGAAEHYGYSEAEISEFEKLSANL